MHNRPAETRNNLLELEDPPLRHTQWPIGAHYLGEGRCTFCVWAPEADRVAVHLLGSDERTVALQPDGCGYHAALIEGVEPGARYLFRLDDTTERPDPASRYQPEGVHRPSEVIGQDFDWHDGGWIGPALQEYIQYELHVGTFTPEGTFEAVIPHLPRLKDLGITVLEIMPVAQFPGERNWGYDGVYPFAVQNSYGGPLGLKRLVDACHRQGLAATLDVVYNHLGAEGNYLWDYGPYFTDRYKTSWGSAVNFDGPQSDEVRSYFIENALYWLRNFHVDALRLDAVHAMLDFSAGTFLERMAQAVEAEGRRAGRRLYLIGESDLNDPRIVRTWELHGFGLHAQWADDLHHALHVLLTGETDGYYGDYAAAGPTGDSKLRPVPSVLARTLRDGYAYTGQYSAYRQRSHGAAPRDVPAYRFVVCAQNHDQVGNRMLGERLSGLVPYERLQLAAGTVLLSPFIPLLFMGEEYGETAPFQYFISHGDPELVKAVREGRRAEFAAFAWQGSPPDPAAEETFQRSKLDLRLSEQGWHAALWQFYRRLIELRRSVPALHELSKDDLESLAFDAQQVLYWRRWAGDSQAWAVFNYGEQAADLLLPVPAGRWLKAIDSHAWPAEEGESEPAREPAAELVSDGAMRVEVPGLAFQVFVDPQSARTPLTGSEEAK
jgi:maltooligosyltrehalose trehalohydrolase